MRDSSQTPQRTFARSMAWAAVLGVTVAAGAAYGLSQPAWRNLIPAWLSGAERAGEATVMTEDWPICTTMASLDSVEGLDPDFAAGKKALAKASWKDAITALELAILRDPSNADIHNYIGYAHHRLRQLGPAMQHYQQALTFNRRHRGAHEHLGELYLALGEPSKAEGQLVALEDICLIPCEEFGDLKRVIATYKASAGR
jgi:tetratricopeptide (TPR) repeat protein